MSVCGQPANSWIWAGLVVLILVIAALAEEIQKGQIRTGFEILDGPIQKVLWCGESTKGNRLLLTNKGTLYSSSDHGFNWTSLKPTLKASTFVAGGSTSGVVRTIMQSPINPSLILLQGRKGVSWASNNCAKTIKVLRHGKRAFRFEFHPQFSNFLLAGFLPSSNRLLVNPKAKKPLLAMFISKDWGETWTLLRRDVLDFGWGCNNSSTHFDTIVALVSSDSLLKYSRNGKLLVSPTPQYSTITDDNVNADSLPSNYQVVASDDFFRTEWVIKKNANRLILLPHYLYVTSLTSKGLELFVADLAAPPKSLAQPSAPFQIEKTHFPANIDLLSSLTFTHTASQRVCLASGPESALFCSDSCGRTFTQILPSVKSNQFGMVDFVCLHSPTGVCLANTPTSSVILQGWHSSPEEQFTSGCDSPTSSDCKLHVDSLTSLFTGQVVSSPSAPGVVLAAGHTDKTGHGVFLSRDAANTWTFLTSGKFIFTFADQGGLVLLAPADVLADSVLFSWDYGTTFVSLRVCQEKVYFVRLHTDKPKKGVFFLLEAISHGGLGISIPLDFSFLMPRQCQDQDFETWKFGDSATENCSNGFEYLFLRRKLQSNCFIPDKVDLISSRLQCECSDHDLECTEGLTKVGNRCGMVEIKEGKQMIDESKTAEYLEAPPSNCNHSYTTRPAYRKARDSACVSHKQFEGRIELCPHRKLQL